MDKNSRTKNSILTVFGNYSTQLLSILARFIDRTIFIYFMGIEFLGINGLFTSILSVLAMSELGIGVSIVYYMYKPIADSNIGKLKVYVSFFKRCYVIIGTVIFGLGLVCIPALPYIINLKTGVHINIYVIYIMYLFNISSSYWFYSYAQTVISAHQKQYLTAKYDILFVIVNSLVTVIILVITRSFYIYLGMQIIITLCKGLMIKNKCMRLYPWLKEKCNEHLSKQEKKSIYRDVYSIMLTKVSATLGNSFDNLIVSAVISTAQVGLISNYTMVQQSITNLIHQLINSFSPSVGNLITESTKEKHYSVFRQLDFINYYCMYFSTVSLFALLPYFVEVWLGPGYQLDSLTLFFITFNNYICNTLYATWMFKDAMGLFVYGRYIQLFVGIANLFLSIIFALKFGMAGVYAASFVTNLIIAVPPFTFYLFKYGFKRDSKEQLINSMKRLLFTIAISLLLYFLLKFLPQSGLIMFLIRFLICVLVSNILFIAVYYNNIAFRSLLSRLNPVLKKLWN